MQPVTHQAYDDYERMIKGAPGVESIYYWDKARKGVHRRGAGEGSGAHVCTGEYGNQQHPECDMR